MLFDVNSLRDAAAGGAITQAILARHPDASVSLQLDNRRVRVEGLLTEEQVLAVLSDAGHLATVAPPHTGEGSTCCGGCS